MSLPAIKNRVGNAVTGTPGTGTITLASALTGYQSFAAAYAADASVDVLVEDGDAWEIARDCTYTHTGTTLSRGTLEASSAGSALSLTSAAKCYVIETAARLTAYAAAGLGQAKSESPTTAGVTGEVGTMHVLDISGLTASQDFTLPATAAVGDRVGVMLSVGDATYELLIKPAAGDTINGGSAGAEWSRLFRPNEVVVFRCVTAESAWIIETDGRIPVIIKIVLSQTHTAPTAWQIVDFALATITGETTYVDVANDAVKVRRDGMFTIGVRLSFSASAINKYCSITSGEAFDAWVEYFRSGSDGTGTFSTTGTTVTDMVVGATYKAQISHDDSTSEVISVSLTLVEQLR